MKVELIDYSIDVDNMLTKIEKLKKLYDGGKMDFNLIRYIPDLTDIAYRRQIYLIQTKRKCASETYTQKNNLEFEIILPLNEYANFNSMLLCLPINIKSKADNDNYVAAGTVSVNTFFAH